MRFVKGIFFSIFSLVLVTCKPGGNQNADDKGQTASGAFMGSCQITTAVNLAGSSPFKECWEWYGGTTTVAQSKCDLTNVGSTTARFGTSACDRSQSSTVCKLPFGKSMYEILFAYGHQCVGTKLDSPPAAPVTKQGL